MDDHPLTKLGFARRPVVRYMTIALFGVCVVAALLMALLVVRTYFADMSAGS